jgi:hypothetical protein
MERRYRVASSTLNITMSPFSSSLQRGKRALGKLSRCPKWLYSKSWTTSCGIDNQERKRGEEIYTEIDRQTDRQRQTDNIQRDKTDRETDRQTDRQIDKQTDKQTDR